MSVVMLVHNNPSIAASGASATYSAFLASFAAKYTDCHMRTAPSISDPTTTTHGRKSLVGYAPRSPEISSSPATKSTSSVWRASSNKLPSTWMISLHCSGFWTPHRKGSVALSGMSAARMRCIAPSGTGMWIRRSGHESTIEALRRMGCTMSTSDGATGMWPCGNWRDSRGSGWSWRLRGLC